MSNSSSELPGSVELFATAAHDSGTKGSHGWRYACPHCDQLTATDPHAACVDCAKPQPARRRASTATKKTTSTGTTAKTVKPGASGGER